MRIDILTLFPSSVHTVLHESILGRAAAKGLIEINCVQIRDYTENRQCQVDDYPYGGGWGCVMMAQPLKKCLDAVMKSAGERKSRVIYLSPQGQPFTQETAKRLQREYDHLVLVCGHYEGVDERFVEACVDEEISLGDFVLTGGEIAAMAVSDAVCRLVPGVLSDEACYTDESHWDGLLEYPQYTRPEVWEGRHVPEVLLNGDHAKITHWRRKQQILRTRDKRPDLYQKADFSLKEDRMILQEIERDALRFPLTEALSCRTARVEDLPVILQIVSDARRILAQRRIDQWQGDYPTEKDFSADIDRGECYLIFHGEEAAGVFTLSGSHQAEYDALTDGKWACETGHYCVLHRAALLAKYRGSGISRFLLKQVEEIACSGGFDSVRTDTHRKNKGMRSLLLNEGFAFRGNVLVSTEPGHDPHRQAFEKIL
ncbi:MAG: tRNA (guanosine(37)-N1)-methyltransferase TrmD [Oscillospiraceae bacterium]|nr:tRNA (guanosine(37)-N1)-methyltransferase TrmD [Oscillospiraceae bacterium]